MNFNLRQPKYFIFLIVFIGIALASSNSYGEQQSAGKTIMARGDVSATNTDNGTRELSRRAPVFKIDSVNTGQLSATQLRMIDGGLLSLQQDTELVIADYEFDAGSEQGSISMSLLKGGLRTVTGALQSNKDNYQLNTPIASIGVRGTHYEAELFEGDLYLAGWEGAIDVLVDTTNQTFSLGPEEDYRFAIVRSDGSVDFLLAAPPLFSDGHSSNLVDSEPFAPLPPVYSLVNAQSLEQDLPLDETLMFDLVGETFIDNDLLVSRFLPEETVTQRTGSVTFNQVTENTFISTAGAVSNLNMAITVDFNTASIPTGNLSFTDAEGEWFAAFNGLVNANALDVNINFASHNNNLATGTLTGLFIDDATGILGTVNLFEINQPNIEAGGSFILTERIP